MANAASADLSALALDLASASGMGAQKAAQSIIMQGALRVQSEAQSMAPIKSGRLRNSISIKYPQPLTAIIGPQVEYGVYQEFGTGTRGEFPGAPIKITAKNGGLLKFKIGNRTIYTRSVNHPGVRARRFMRGGLEAALGQEIVSRLAKAGALLITKGPNA